MYEPRDFIIVCPLSSSGPLLTAGLPNPKNYCRDQARHRSSSEATVTCFCDTRKRDCINTTIFILTATPWRIDWIETEEGGSTERNPGTFKDDYTTEDQSHIFTFYSVACGASRIRTFTSCRHLFDSPNSSSRPTTKKETIIFIIITKVIYRLSALLHTLHIVPLPQC